ncbi:MAG: diphosphomevalonate decarboxylase, partial [Chloroflexota bacterium]
MTQETSGLDQQTKLKAQASKTRQATALAHPNIAFIKYWGNENNDLRLPANGSFSMNLESLHTTTTVTWDETLETDQLIINDQPITGAALERVTNHLDLVRHQADLNIAADVKSASNFPVGSGIASSASAFSALSVAAAAAAGLSLDEAGLSRLARRGSGSASRSIPAGYCQWLPGNDRSSIATSIAAPDYWDLRDLVVIVSREHKATGSTGGHQIASTSSLQTARIAAAPIRLEACIRAFLDRKLAIMGPIIEEDTVIMHSVMMSCHPPLYYWNEATMAIIQATQRWRDEGLGVYFTIDAGPNVHLICEASQANEVEAAAKEIEGVLDVISSGAGGPAR